MKVSEDGFFMIKNIEEEGVLSRGGEGNELGLGAVEFEERATGVSHCLWVVRVGGDSDTQVRTTSMEVKESVREGGREENKSKAEVQGTAGFKEPRGGRAGRADKLPRWISYEPGRVD